MKNLLCLLALLLCTTVFAQPQQVVVGVSGNGYVTRQQDGARITQRGVTHWTNPKSIVSIYFYLHQPTTADLSLYAKGHSEIKVSYGKKGFKSIYNRMISLKFLLEVSIYDRQGMSVSTYKESLKVVRVSEKLSS